MFGKKKVQLNANDIVNISAILRDYRNTHEDVRHTHEAYVLGKVLRNYGIKVEYIPMPLP